MFRTKKIACTTIGLLGIAACQSLAQNSLVPISVASGTGSYTATAATTTEMPENTIFLPAKPVTEKLPVVLWGNGGCMENALAYGIFLREIASHGYLVIAAGKPVEEGKSAFEEARGRLENADSRAPGISADQTTAEQLISGLNWAIAANKNIKHSLYNQLDTANVAVMGHSCGGLQAIEVATDERIKTSIIFNSGVLNEPKTFQSTALKVPKAMLLDVSGPMAYINGGPEDIAYFNALDDFIRTEHVPVLFAENGVGHGGTFRFPDGGAYAVVAKHWLNWQLKGSKASSLWFKSEDCQLCQDMDWQVQSKLIKE